MTFSFLILEDEQQFINKIDSVIKSMDINSKVLTAYNVEEALKKAYSTAIDVFLVDINLNEPRTGLDFIREVREEYPLSPVIIISALSEIHHKITAFNDLKVLGYIDKPFENEQVITDLLKALEIAKIINNRTVTFKRQNFARTYRTKDIYCIQRMPKGKKRIVVTAYDETTGDLATDEFSIKSSLAEVLELFLNDQDVVRCHQSWIVNPKYIRGFDVNKEELILVNNIKIPLGDTYKHNVASFI
ncbi:MAG: response regulator [Defluviitaleaceae bacterium]|nr:response regulator [Defluviitaleaceae bacterium]